MDAAFVPTEIAVRHFVQHKFIIELGPTVTALGKPIRNALLAALLIKCSFDLVQAAIGRWRISSER